MPNVTDLQVADNILPFAQLAIEKGKLLDSLVAELSEVGFVLNADKKSPLNGTQPTLLAIL